MGSSLNDAKVIHVFRIILWCLNKRLSYIDLIYYNLSNIVCTCFRHNMAIYDGDFGKLDVPITKSPWYYVYR